MSYVVFVMCYIKCFYRYRYYIGMSCDWILYCKYGNRVMIEYYIVDWCYWMD